MAFDAVSYAQAKSSQSTIARVGAFTSGPRLLALVGDSRTAGIGSTLHLQTNWAAWCATLSQGRIRVDSSVSYGVAGAHTGPASGVVIIDMIAQARLAAASAAEIVAVWGGTNDALAEDTFGNITTICDILTDAGKAVVLIAEAPRDIALSATAYKRFGIREHCRRLAGRNGVVVIDVYLLTSDPASATGAFKAGMSYDGLHLTTTGAFTVGKEVARIINQLYPEVPMVPGILPAMFDATYNPYGSMLANPGMSGTSGSLATGVTGSLATSWSVARAGTGISAVASKVTDNSGYSAQQLVYSGTSAAGDLIKFRQDVPIGNLVAGDVIEGVAYVEIDAGATGIASPALELTGTGGASPFVSILRAQTQAADGDAPAAAWAGYLRTPRMTHLGTTTTLRLEFTVRGQTGATVNLTARVRGMTAYKV